MALAQGIPGFKATQAQAESWAYQAGFRGQGLADIVGIAGAESQYFTNAFNGVGNVAGVDRGILQINSAFHPDVPDSAAYDPVQAFRSAFAISKGGTDFTSWVTFDTGAYKSWLPKGLSLPSIASPVQGVGQGISTVGQGVSAGAQNVTGNVGAGISAVAQGVAQGLPGLLQRGGLFIVAILAVILGIVLIANNPISQAGRQAGQAVTGKAAKAAASRFGYIDEAAEVAV